MRHLLFVLVLTLATVGHTRPPPLAFEPEELAWTASEIVVVAPHQPLDGDVVVLESWRGSLRAGERLRVPELARFAGDELRRLRGGWTMYTNWERDLPRTIVPANRLIFFMRRKGTRELWVGYRNDVPFTVTFALSDGKRIYAYAEDEDSDPRLIDQHLTEEELARRVRDIVRRRTAIEAAQEKREIGKLVAFTRSPDTRQREAAMVALSRCGADALPSLRALVGDAIVSPDELRDAIARIEKRRR
jgi:hypothetical protein